MTRLISRIATEIARAQPRSDTPRYRQVIDVLLATIERGLLAPGDQLPPETKLASLFSVSLGTAQKALTHLASLGVLQRVRRKGTMVAGRQAEDVFVFRFKEPGTGRIFIPFTRVLSIAVTTSMDLGAGFSVESATCGVDRLVWVKGEAPAFSQVRIAIEHGRSLLKMPIESLHGLSFHKVLGRKFNLPTVRTSHRLQRQRSEPDGVPQIVCAARHVRDDLGGRRLLLPAGDDLSVAANVIAHWPIELDIPDDEIVRLRPIGRWRRGVALMVVDRQALGSWALTAGAAATLALILLPLVFVSWLAFFQQPSRHFRPRATA